MWPFNKNEEIENPEEDYNKNPNWFAEKLYNKCFQSEGNWGVICNIGGDGLINCIELLPFMENKGWIFVSHSFCVGPTKELFAEYVFRRKN